MLGIEKGTGRYYADFQHRVFGRVKIRLRTTVKSIAMHRHSALEQLLDAGEPVRDLVEALRARKLTIASVYECVRARKGWEALRASSWPTLGEGRDRYLAHLAASEGSDKTTLSVQHALRHALLFFGAARRLESITHDEVVGFKTYLGQSAKEGGAGLHPNTVALYLTKFGALYTFLQERETKRARQQKRTPATLFSPLDRDEHVPKHTKTRVRFLSETEAELALTGTPDALKLAPALGIFAGLRGGEMLMLRPELDLNVERGIIFVQARDGWQPKHGRNREIPISRALRPYVERHLAEHAGEDYVFPGREPGTPRTLRNLEHHFERAVLAAGLEPGREHPMGVTLHTLRHTFASWLVMAGADLLTVSRLLGHSTIKQVQDTYAHLSPGHLQATVDLLSARWAARRAELAELDSEPGLDTAGTPLETP
jgi:integrase